MGKNERVALVTGAGRGIGAAVGTRLLKSGFEVHFADAIEDRAKAYVAALGDGRGQAFAWGMDVTSDSDVGSVIGAVGARHGRIEVLVNNAGIINQRPTQHIPTSDWNELIDVHLGGTFRCSRAAFPFLSAAGQSTIVNVSSIAGQMGMPIRASYCAAKAAIEGFTRSLAAEWAEFGIRVNAVAPGYVRTELIQKDLTNGLVSEEQLAARISMKRLADPSEIAETMLFLATEASSYITGQVIHVDGGLSIDFDPGNTKKIAS
jgi:NAD(P)-dependent dehydrogenase (short-subunit alcohol dehydrogenase family)